MQHLIDRDLAIAILEHEYETNTEFGMYVSKTGLKKIKHILVHDVPEILGVDHIRKIVEPVTFNTDKT